MPLWDIQGNQLCSGGGLDRMYFKYILELCRFCVGFLKKSREVDVEESGNMTQVEQTDVSQVDGLLKQHIVRNHAPGDKVPQSPDVLKILNRWYPKGRGGIWPFRYGIAGHDRGARRRQ
jgi:hypothetical protein